MTPPLKTVVWLDFCWFTLPEKTGYAISQHLRADAVYILTGDVFVDLPPCDIGNRSKKVGISWLLSNLALEVAGEVAAFIIEQSLDLQL